jgi:Zn-dependent peptidase ImmA (M78 family)
VIHKFRKRVISSLAQEIADMYCSNSLILPEIIARDNEISFNYGFYGDSFDGLIEQLNGCFHIYINLTKVKQPSSTRSRFTFSHELGHYFLDEHRLALEAGRTPSHPSTVDFSSKNLVEQEADYFACSLLMPEERFIKDCKGKRISIDLIRQLGEKYQTSIAATLLRYTSVGTHPVAVVCSQYSKVLWHSMSDDFEFKYLNKSLNKVPAATATGEYYAKKIKYSSPEKIFAEDWFDYVNYKNNTKYLKEQCVYFDSICMVFTIIWQD